MKAARLQSLNKDMQKLVNEFYKDDVRLVYGGGDPDSRIVLVGEAPGKHEIIQNKPFVGQAGKNLDEFIAILGINKEDLYITNTVKLRPYKTNPDTGREANRTPTTAEIRFFADFLKSELSIVHPELVVSLGNIALRSITGDEAATIGLLHGIPIDIEYSTINFKLFPLYHPASIIYRRELRHVYIEDLQKLKAYIKEQGLVH